MQNRYLSMNVTAINKNNGGSIPVTFYNGMIYTLPFSGTMSKSVDTTLTSSLISYNISSGFHAIFATSNPTNTGYNVGIGTFNPRATLDIGTGSFNCGSMLMSSPSYSNTVLALQMSANTWYDIFL